MIYSLRKTAVRSDAVIYAFRQRSHLLDTLRGLMVRSALSPASGSDRAMDASELPVAHLEANEVLAEIGKSLEASGEGATKQQLTELKSSIDEYWDSLPNIREQNGKLPPSVQQAAGSTGRRQIRHIARQISALNREQQDRAETRIQAEQHRLQGEVLLSSSLSLAVVLALIVGMSYRIRRTERYAETQYANVVQARTELRHFATQLEHAQEEERRTLSRELHDAFGQTMAAALVELSRIQNEMIDDDGTKAQLARVKLELEGSMRSIRDIALMLRPSMLDDLGLVPALRWQGREVARRSGLAVRVKADDNSESLPNAYRTCIYRIVQEALHNIVKHACAASAVVVFKWADDALVLTIEDNGKGFSPASEKGMGLLGIEERVGRLSGHVQVTSLMGKGTYIHVTLPLPVMAERELM
ncbi:sensor histidine kinase [Acidipila sp. EB88]|uniref:sensor histidine kinase n=1 Tax=Acidipila sp. EB88 TaxID=2305226 RepID=UPI001F20B8DA|nr:sensor histidine kinase [Acidipila sp. EB88]